MRLENKVIAIPGAGGGMGTAAARLFASEGARLVLVARREPPLQEIAELARSDGGQAVVCSADTATEAGCAAMVEAAVGEFGRLDVVYCNMGDFAYGDLETHQTSPEAWDYLIGLNLRAHFLSARAAIPQMIRQDPPGGVLIHVAASADVLREANPGYSAAKAGLIEFVRRAARQYRDRNIRVHCICPGAVGGDPPPAGPLEPLPPELDRDAKSLDVAYAGLYLASDESSWTTGLVVPVEGGRRL